MLDRNLLNVLKSVCLETRRSPDFLKDPANDAMIQNSSGCSGVTLYFQMFIYQDNYFRSEITARYRKKPYQRLYMYLVCSTSTRTPFRLNSAVNR